MHATVYTPSPDRAAGFTLIELAVVLFILTLMLAGFLVPLATQVDQRNISDTRKTLEDIKEALVGFAMTNGYLPCTDVTSGAGANDGVEDVIAGTCVNPEGNVPWVTLGVAATDVWGNRFRYRVAPGFAQRSPALTFGFTTTADVRVCTTSACTTTLTLASPNGAPAIILSHGKNGLGAINAVTGTANPAPTSADELENTDVDTTYVSRTITPAGATAGEFDDIVTWLGKYTLFQRMVAAGKLP